MDPEKEIWLPVDGFGDRYFISNYGRVKSNTIRSRMRKPHITPNGYESHRLYYKTNDYKVFSGHRLVALHFIPNPENLKEVNHKDGNKRNNHVSNLEWCTGSHNQRHAFSTGLQRARVGNDNILSKEVLAIVGQAAHAYGSMTQASLKIGCSRSSILRSINSGRPIKTGKYKGYEFRFK